MAVDFRIETHHNRNALVIEVWVDGKFRATVYPEDSGIRVVSRYFSSIQYTPGLDPLPAQVDFEFCATDTPTALRGIEKG
jgi:hypothetical protein